MADMIFFIRLFFLRFLNISANLYIGLTKSDLSTLNWVALYDKRQPIFIPKYIKYSHSIEQTHNLLNLMNFFKNLQLCF